MANNQIGGKNLAAVARNIADGFLYLNPLVLKKLKLEKETYKGLYQQIKKTQTEIRNEKFPLHDVVGIRNRNMKLQRLHQALIVLEHTAKEKTVLLY